MTRPRFNLSDLVLLIAFAAIAFAAYRYFWQPPPDPNARLYLSAFLVLLSTATLGSFLAHPRWRRAFQGFAALGWCELVCVAWCGFGWDNFSDARRIAEGSQMGMVFGVLSAILSAWLFEPPGEKRGGGTWARPEQRGEGGSTHE
jgi:hypothetical protein